MLVANECVSFRLEMISRKTPGQRAGGTQVQGVAAMFRR